MNRNTPASDRHADVAAQTRVRVDFRQVREALAAVDQASTVFEGLLVAGAELQAECDRLRDALDEIDAQTSGAFTGEPQTLNRLVAIRAAIDAVKGVG